MLLLYLTGLPHSTPNDLGCVLSCSTMFLLHVSLSPRFPLILATCALRPSSMLVSHYAFAAGCCTKTQSNGCSFATVDVPNAMHTFSQGTLPVCPSIALSTWARVSEPERC